MKATTVTLDVFKQYLGLIGYTLKRLTKKQDSKQSGLRPHFKIIDNLGQLVVCFLVNEELLEFDFDGVQICFFFNECWLETIDDDTISLTDKKENSGIFINFSKQKPIKQNKK